jgi:hypothetical protein
MDDGGNATAVWLEADIADPGGTYANTYSAGGWRTATKIANRTGNDSSFTYPEVAIDERGDAMAVWPLGQFFGASIYADLGSNGAWNPPELVSPISNLTTLLASR